MNMTAPVESIPDTATADVSAAFSEARGNENGGWTYAFVMEKRYSREALPEPNDERIRIRERPERTMAVRRFSGRWTVANVAKQEAALLEAVAAAGLATAGAPVLARYDAPYVPWFLRRNEIMLRVEADTATRGY